jgi:proline dehydrogenase
MSDFSIDFQDTATAFADKTDAELREKYRLFKMLNSPMLNSLGTKAAKFALALNLPVEGLIKRTIYEQFCGGETIEECEGTIERLARSNIGAILDYSVEGKSTEADFDRTKDEIIKTIKRAKDDPRIPFSVFKVTGIAPLGTLERMSAKKKLDAKSQAKSERARNRVLEICEYASSIGQPLFIDAEETWIQDAIDQMATEMMEKFNRDEVMVYNTLQMYRTDRLHFLNESKKRALSGRYLLGIKLVRGAYMEKERERALEKGYASPIHPDKQSTDKDFDAAVDYCLKNLDEISFVCGTHNEASTEKMARKMNDMGIPNDHPHANFSQLYGMGDNISYVLGKNGYNVTKYVPYGPVRDSVPYLIRRAEENTSVAGQVNREVRMIEKELKRRKSR